MREKSIYQILWKLSTVICDLLRNTRLYVHNIPWVISATLLLVFIKMWKRVRSMPGLQEEKRYGNDIRSGHAFKLWNSM